MTPTIDRTSITAAEWRVVGSETKPHLPLWLGVDRDPNRAILALHQILDSGASYRPLIGWIFGPELIPNRALLGAAEKFLEFRALQNSGFLQATVPVVLTWIFGDDWTLISLVVHDPPTPTDRSAGRFLVLGEFLSRPVHGWWEDLPDNKSGSACCPRTISSPRSPPCSTANAP